MATGSLVIAPFAAPLIAPPPTEAPPLEIGALFTEAPPLEIGALFTAAPHKALEIGALEPIKAPSSELTVIDLIIALGLGVGIGALIGGGLTYAAVQFSQAVPK